MTAATPAQDFEQILHELRQPLDMARVKRRQAPGSGTVPYLEGFDVIDTANRIFSYRWSFHLLSEPQITRWERKLTAWDSAQRRRTPVLDAQGQPQTEAVGLIHITGSVTVELDGQVYTHSDIGRCIFSGDSPEALDMALAGCATDCLKRCFRQLGEQFGLSLYDKEIAATAGTGKPAVERPPRMNRSTAAPAQPAAPAPATATAGQPPAERAYQDGTQVGNNEKERSAFDAFRQAQGQPPASRAALREWMRAAPAE